jgi:TRAP-type C4-dicarboxylate transport system substrate-binding protein
MKALLPALLWASLAHADGRVLRLATVAPDGSGWAREFRAFAHDLEQRTAGRLRVKWYFNAVAGDEPEMAERVKRGQLDGLASGGMVCQRVAPSLRVLRIPGLVQTRQEADHLMHGMQATIEGEAQQQGFIYLLNAPLGQEVLLSKHPVHNMTELRAVRAWSWETDDVWLALTREMGLALKPAQVWRAASMLDSGEVDAVWGISTAAVVFEWTLRAPHVLDLHANYLFGCVLIASTALADSSPEDRRELSSAAARLGDRIESVTAHTDDVLFSGALRHQGVEVTDPSESFRAEFFATANAARDRKGAELFPPELLRRVRQQLADYRAEHRKASK